MSRVDIPTLKCDRCESTTQDTRKMAYFKTLTYSHMSGDHKWDLCPECWAAFTEWLADAEASR